MDSFSIEGCKMQTDQLFELLRQYFPNKIHVPVCVSLLHQMFYCCIVTNKVSGKIFKRKKCGN